MWLTERAQRVLADARDDRRSTVHPGGTVITRSGTELRWWTWAGFRTNATLVVTLSDLTDEKHALDDVSVRLHSDLTREDWLAGTADAAQRLCLPMVRVSTRR